MEDNSFKHSYNSEDVSLIVTNQPLQSPEPNPSPFATITGFHKAPTKDLTEIYIDNPEQYSLELPDLNAIKSDDSTVYFSDYSPEENYIIYWLYNTLRGMNLSFSINQFASLVKKIDFKEKRDILISFLTDALLVPIKTPESPILKETKSKSSLSLSKIKLDDSPRNENEIECLICFATVQFKEIETPLKCKHKFCTHCIAEYLLNKINTNDGSKMRCPFLGCNEEYNEPLIETYVSNEYFLKYRRFQNLNLLNSNPDLRWCPRPGCDKHLTGSIDHPHLKCECGQEFCFKCREVWHEDKTCEEILQEQFSKLTSELNLKLCPKCKTRTEKIEGCDHMTCFICKHEYCWLCMMNYTYDHYTGSAINRCAAIVWEMSIPDYRRHRRWRKCKKCCCKLCDIICYIILLPLIIAVFFALIPLGVMGGSAIALISCGEAIGKSCKGACCTFLLSLIGFVCTPIPLIVLLVCYLMNKWCCHSPWIAKWIKIWARYIEQVSPVTISSH
jgi:hypothetical protein